MLGIVDGARCKGCFCESFKQVPLGVCFKFWYKYYL